MLYHNALHNICKHIFFQKWNIHFIGFSPHSTVFFLPNMRCFGKAILQLGENIAYFFRYSICKGAELASATVAWHWLFFCLALKLSYKILPRNNHTKKIALRPQSGTGWFKPRSAPLSICVVFVIWKLFRSISYVLTMIERSKASLTVFD